MPARTNTWLPLFALFGVAVSLGAGHVAARLAFANGVNVITAATVRSVCAGLLLLVLLRLRREAVLPLPPAFGSTIVLGVLIAAQTVCIQVAVALMPVTLAILVFYTYPFLTGVAASLLGDERFTPRLAGALLAAFAGLALVLGVEPQPVSVWGFLAALGAAAAFSAAIVLTPRLAPGLSTPLRTFFMLAATAAIFVAASAATRAFHLPATGAGWTGLAGLTLGYSLGITGLFLLLPRLGAVQTSIVLNLEPVAVATIAWAALGEALTLLQVAGAVVVVATVILFRTTARQS
ncbi:MAG TPA: EamA family transporter [Burkholderiales bacterium]|nr:EamA family transporter [Burkholderiales bacterium]